MVSNILKSFPKEYTPSPQQEDLLTSIEKAFDEGHKFVVCSAPTGSGKSFISKTYGNVARGASDTFKDLVNSYKIYKRSNISSGFQGEDELEDEPSFGAFVLTITKSLQDQYHELFNDIAVLKGKSNYQCAYDSDYAVDCAPCVHIKNLKEQCWTKDICPYYKARNKALTANLATLNYNMFFSLPEHLKKRQYLICDEAAELEDQIVKEYSCTINFQTLTRNDIYIKPFPTGNNYSAVGNWLISLNGSITNKIENLKEEISKGTKTPHIESKIKYKKDILATFINLQHKITAVIDTWSDSEYLFERTKDSVDFVPLKVDKLAQNLFQYADKIILMSATIIDPVSYCKSLGITDYKYVEAKSVFDPKKAPIYTSTKVKLNYNNLQDHLPKIAQQIREICNIHKGDKGIIHSQTNSITKYLQKVNKSSRFLYREAGVRNEELLDTHYNTSDPTVLVSPSMSHGIDLKDDLARFQIIIKAPYLPTLDKRVARMMKLDFNWYVNKMISAVIQACGRGIRTKDDHCVTYILDSAISEQIVKNKHKIPKYFLDRFM